MVPPQPTDEQRRLLGGWLRAYPHGDQDENGIDLRLTPSQRLTRLQPNESEGKPDE